MENRPAESHYERLRALPIQISVCVCRRSLSLDDLLEWKSGTVLSFDQDASAPLQLRIGDKSIAEGHAVKIGTQIGLRLKRVG
jgi:flagellar motor switch/type III secretory pathway protein FliN